MSFQTDEFKKLVDWKQQFRWCFVEWNRKFWVGKAWLAATDRKTEIELNGENGTRKRSVNSDRLLLLS